VKMVSDLYQCSTNIKSTIGLMISLYRLIIL